MQQTPPDPRLSRDQYRHLRLSAGRGHPDRPCRDTAGTRSKYYPGESPLCLLPPRSLRLLPEASIRIHFTTRLRLEAQRHREKQRKTEIRTTEYAEYTEKRQKRY